MMFSSPFQCAIIKIEKQTENVNSSFSLPHSIIISVSHLLCVHILSTELLERNGHFMFLLNKVMLLHNDEVFPHLE